ncbi:sugar ABC transporter ATP-binding protein [Acrocarpospora macrocephala]|uniref:Putative ribose/galactose/methyl galactoside import ATP-binding protein 3 n=1 Tax=Acrocarpospora macrocephala TaxID=150177 RepID=A0A5M3WDM2_9ACTN|nr:sugar ABC transporter ATP-binding protein [Acrocarpospora macrocephala]GES07167.1 putative ribose/galactose/methyl galactoside import ATP-binding protein 3 [Acrocarpospora macrocephala]
MTADPLPPPVLEARGVTMTFPGVKALTEVSLTVGAGEVIGLVGENGAGKSTLLSILSGSLRPGAGEIVARGRTLHLHNYAQANEAGIFRAHQDQGLIDNLTVAANLFLGHERRFSRGGLLQHRRLLAAARRQIQADTMLAGRVSEIDQVGDLPLDVRQLVEIARAFAVAELLEVSRPVVLLDETTASLNQDEVTELFAHVRDRRDRASFVFVSHRLNEILELCDRVYVLKDGVVVAERKVGETSEAELHRLMVGREREENHYLEDRRRTQFGAVRLKVDDLSSGDEFHGVSLDVREGEILAVGGITGCGKSHLARAIAGDVRASGTVEVDGRRLPNHRPAARRGRLAFGPLDRHAEGVSLLQSVRWNMTWSSLRDHSRGPFLSPRREKRAVAAGMARYRVAAPSMDTRVGALSGGNQQKVMLARLAGSGARVLVLDNPTRGVDVGARQEIYGHLRDLADAGFSILLVSDDLRELIGMGDRVAVMRDGQVVREWESRGLTEEQIIVGMV